MQVLTLALFWPRFAFLKILKNFITKMHNFFTSALSRPRFTFFENFEIILLKKRINIF